ncbi:MAG: hypothetical protein KGN01_07185 [Patescibacteria group bacterium]|nr:hypothetical protein [Patescibacteria group bacterium]
MMTFKTFGELKAQQDAFTASRQAAVREEQIKSAWRWFERNIGYKEDAVINPLRRVHGRKGTYYTMRPLVRRKVQVKVAAA